MNHTIREAHFIFGKNRPLFREGCKAFVQEMDGWRAQEDARPGGAASAPGGDFPSGVSCAIKDSSRTDG